MMTQTDPIISLKDVIKIYKRKDVEVIALSGLSLQILRGSMIAVIGSSGSGKSTLMKLIGGLDQATAGHITVNGIKLNNLSFDRLNLYRRKMIGFMWQHTSKNLLSYLNAMENIELTMMIGGRIDRQWAEHLLNRTGLSGMMRKKPTEMSGGQQQRLALAVALANKPQILLADEPTGAVDTMTAEAILELMHDLRSEMNLTVVVVTHDPRINRIVDRAITISDGRIAQEAFGTWIPNALANIPVENEESVLVIDDKGMLQLPKSLLKSEDLSYPRYFTVHAERNRIILTSSDSAVSSRFTCRLDKVEEG